MSELVSLLNQMLGGTEDHSMHAGHAGHAAMSQSTKSMPMPDDMCSMNMLFTWNYKNMCVVFKWWHVRTQLDLILTILAIVALSYGYEYVRHRMRLLDLKATSTVENSQGKVRKSLGYALLVAYSYFLMLVFMTYNGWAMSAVAIGAGLGHYTWGQESARTMACH